MLAVTRQIRTLGLFLLLALVATAGQAEAVGSGLIRIFGTSDTYYVDDLGVLHPVPSMAVRRAWFGSSPIEVVHRSEIAGMPLGRTLTLSAGPSLVERRTIIRPGRIDVQYGAAPIVRRKVVTVEEIEDLEDIEDLYEE